MFQICKHLDEDPDPDPTVRADVDPDPDLKSPKRYIFFWFFLEKLSLRQVSAVKI
jgi:hypothetical protein